MGIRSLEPQGNPLLGLVPATGVWQFLWKYKGIISFIIIVSVLGINLYFKDLKIASQNEKITALQSAVDFRDEQIKNCKDSFDSLAQDIQDNATQTEKLLKSFGEFAESVEKDFNNQERQIRNLRNINTPKTCEESIQLLRDNIGTVKWNTPNP